MYGTKLGVANTAAGISLLPATGDSSVLFTVAASMIALGVAVLIASTVLARKSSVSEAN